MARVRVTNEELAERAGVSTVYISSLRRGKARPSDDLKVTLARVTREMEELRGLAPPYTGVPVEAWFPRDTTKGGN